jgi:hypothetical protein
MEVMGKRTRIQQQRRLIEAHRSWDASRSRMTHFQLTVAQHMQIAITFTGIEMAESA